MRVCRVRWLALWLAMIPLGSLSTGCAEQHIFSRNQLPTKNLCLYKKDAISQYLARDGYRVHDYFNYVSTNESGTAIFITDPLASMFGVTCVVSEEREEILTMQSCGNRSAVDEKFQTTAWVESGPFFGGPVHFSNGYRLSIDDPVFTRGGFDPSGRYFWTEVGPGSQQYMWDANHATDLIQIRDTRQPENVLISFRERFMPLQLFSHNEKLYLFGSRHRDNSYPPNVRVCLVFGQEGQRWNKQSDFEIPLDDWDGVKCWGIDQGSDFALLCDIKDFVPIPYLIVEWHLLNLQNGKMIQLDFLNSQGWGHDAEDTVPLFLQRDFLSDRIRNVRNDSATQALSVSR